MPATIISDSELTQALKMGSESAFEQIYERYWHKLYRVALNKVQAPENAKEIVQEIFLDLWSRREVVDITTLDRYLFSAVKFKVLDFFKSEIIRKNHEQFVLFSQSDAHWDTEQELAYNDLNQMIIACIDQLPAKTKLIFELSKIQHQSNIEIARVLNISHRTVEYHLSQGLNSLRLMLRDYIVIALLILTHYSVL